jgi:hypothetical protein
MMGNKEYEIKPKIPPHANPIGIAFIMVIGTISINVSLKRMKNRREKKLETIKSLKRKNDPNRISIVLDSKYVKKSMIAKKIISKKA